jgi:predicted nucleic acid-binding protein
VNSYLDTSALVKLVLEEPGTEAVVTLWDQDSDRLASLLAYAELRAAVAAAGRSGRIPRSGAADARLETDTIWQRVIGVEIDESLVRTAGELAERHGLRAADAIHLASAIRVREAGTVFVSFDHRLREAAAAEGFAVLPETV